MQHPQKQDTEQKHEKIEKVQFILVFLMSIFLALGLTSQLITWAVTKTLRTYDIIYLGVDIFNVFCMIMMAKTLYKQKREIPHE